MSSSDDDEDLKCAIALSLQHLPSPLTGTPREAINLDGGSDEDPSLFKFSATARKISDELTRSVAAPIDPDTKPNQTTPESGLSLLGLDRKQMERERLARKRKLSISPPPPRKALKPAVNDSRVTSAPQTATSTSSHKITTVHPRISSRTTNSTPSSPAVSNGQGAVFLNGTVKKTWAFGHPRKDDIKLEEVLQKDDLTLAVLSSFQWDMDWLFAKINIPSTQLTLVMQAKDEATKQQYRRETASLKNLRFCFPSMEGQVSCMHSKLMLLSHPTHLRVVVPTANLVTYDWGESGDMENMVFLIDLPRLPEGQRTETEELTFFGQELIYFVNAMGLEQSIINSVHNFDFTATKDIAFVHTIGGAHSGDDDPWRRTGYCGLGRAIQQLGLATNRRLRIDFVASSIGSLNIDFLVMLYLAAQGDDGLTEYEWRNPAKIRQKPKSSTPSTRASNAAQETLKSKAREAFHLYFPTHDTVRGSTAGFAGTICFSSKWYNAPTFPRHILRDCKSVRPGMLMHNKILFVRPPAGEGRSWAYVGSANCSESAWGKLSKDRATKRPKLNCRNWECGVIIKAGEVGGEAGYMAVFEGVVPVPMVAPGEEYGARKPWFSFEQ